MRIISTPLPAELEHLTDERQTIVMALDTLVEDKSLVVGLLQGTLVSNRLDGIRVSPVGQLVIDRSCRHHQRLFPEGIAVVAGVADARNAPQRVRDVLAKAPPEALVLLVCSTGKAYDAAYAALGIDFTAARSPRQ